MGKKLSGWYRLFIIFAGVWTILSIGIFAGQLGKVTSGWQRQIDTIDKNQDIETQKLTEENMRMFEKVAKKEVRFRFLLYWLAPIGFVYGVGWTTGWIIRGFRKDKQ